MTDTRLNAQKNLRKECRMKTNMNTITFDFEDGNGQVPAHQHPNGGGWVADTTSVAPVYLGEHNNGMDNQK